MTTRKHILVVEDEEHLATGIKYNLDAEGYRVTTVGDGPSALKTVEENPDGVDLVILDLMLPGMSGYALCEAIRSREDDTPVLILSARTLAEDRARGFDVGAGPGKPLDRRVAGGVVGLMIDTRGRPFKLPTDERERVSKLDKWAKAFDAYPAGEA